MTRRRDPRHSHATPRRRALAVAAVALAAALAGCGARAATYRWGAMASIGRYVVDMDTLKRAGPRATFTVLFVPEATRKTPALGGLYVRADHWIDCASGLHQQTSTQSFLMSGRPVDMRKGPDEAPSPIRPGSTWTEVRDLVCTGRNEIDLPRIVGTDAAVAAQVRARMAAHPIVGTAD